MSTILVSPKLLTAVFVIYFVASPILVMQGSWDGMRAYQILSIFVLGVYLVWPISMFAAIGRAAEKKNEPAPVFAVASFVTIAFVISFIPWLVSQGSGYGFPAEIVFGAIATLAAIAIPLVFILSSKRLVDAEVGLSLAQPRILLTILALLYLPIGVWWLASRINRIQATTGR